MAECGRWLKNYLLKKLLVPLWVGDAAALEHSVLSRKETLVSSAGNTNWFSQDKCVLNLQIALTQGLFRVLRESYYFCFSCWHLATQKMQWGLCKVPGSCQWREDPQMSSLLTTSKESIHARWSCSEHTTRHSYFCGLSFTNKDPFRWLQWMVSFLHGAITLPAMWMCEFLTIFFCGCFAINLLYIAID